MCLCVCTHCIYDCSYTLHTFACMCRICTHCTYVCTYVYQCVKCVHSVQIFIRTHCTFACSRPCTYVYVAYVHTLHTFPVHVVYVHTTSLQRVHPSSIYASTHLCHRTQRTPHPGARQSHSSPAAHTQSGVNRHTLCTGLSK